MPEEQQKEPKKGSKATRPRWRKKRWWALILILATLVWFDGPGWRFIATKAADHYLPELGFQADFKLSGRLSGGEIGVQNLSLSSDSVVTDARLGDLQLKYQLAKIITGEVDSIVLKHLHASIDLAAIPEKDEKPDEEKTDLGELLTQLRQRIVPMNIEVRDLSTTIVRDQQLVYSIESTTLIHSPGSNSFLLDLGAMEFPAERRLAAQSTTLEWNSESNRESIQLAKLDLMPGLGIRDFHARIPANESISLSTGLLLDGVRFDAQSDLKTAHLIKAPTPLNIHHTAKLFDIDLPATATLHSFTLDARHLDGGLETLEAELQLSLSDIDYDDWTSSRLSLAAKLEGDQAQLAIEGEALGSPLTIQIKAALDRSAKLLPTEADLDFKIPQLAQPLTYLRERFTPSEKPAAPPASSLSGSAHAGFSDGRPDQATAQLAIISSEDAPPIDLKGSWSTKTGAHATIAIPSIQAEADFDPDKQSYQGKAVLNNFSPTSLSAWLAPFNIKLPPGINASLSWEGGGQIKQNTHQGKLEISAVEWLKDSASQPIKAFASASYDWPESLSLAPLNVQQAAQKIEGELSLENQTLSLSKLAWSDGDDTLFQGTAKIPVPEDLSDWKALLRETRPIEVDLKSIELPLTKLHPFLPESTRFPKTSLAKLDIKLSGTPSDPILKAQLKVTQLGILSQPSAPPVNIELQAVGQEHTLKLEGEVTAPNYPPAIISAITNWDPGQWAQDPQTVQQAKLDASAKISDFKLSLFSDFLPKTRRLEGDINLLAELSGTVGQPEILGSLTLDGGRFEMHNPSIPRLKNGTLKLSANPERITLETLSGSISGGDINLTGTLDIKDGAPSGIDLKIIANSLPAKRDDAMIIRVNTDLSIRGPWETATIGGTVSIADSLFFKDIEIIPIGVPFHQPDEPTLPSVDTPEPAKLAATIPEPFNNWGLNLKLKTTNPFLIRGNLINGEVYLDVDVSGTIANPRPTGAATLREIVARLPFSTLKIKRGQIKFDPNHPFDPVLDIRGESSIRPYQVNVYIYGPISKPKVLPSSNPPLPENEIMTLVATGATTSGLEDSSAATGRAAQLLIEELRRSKLSKSKIFGPLISIIDKVDFQVGESDPYSSTKYSSASININDNWMIKAGVSEENNTRTSINYLFRFR